jgi:hypothetical protein
VNVYLARLDADGFDTLLGVFSTLDLAKTAAQLHVGTEAGTSEPPELEWDADNDDGKNYWEADVCVTDQNDDPDWEGLFTIEEHTVDAP